MNFVEQLKRQGQLFIVFLIFAIFVRYGVGSLLHPVNRIGKIAVLILELSVFLGGTTFFAKKRPDFVGITEEAMRSYIVQVWNYISYILSPKRI
jgi:hypothetical protein